MIGGDLSQERVSELPILAQSIDGFKTVLSQTLGKRGAPPIPVVVVSGDYELRQQYIEKGKTSLPLVGIITSMFDANPANTLTYNNQALFNGIPIKFNGPGFEKESEHGIIRLHCVDVGFTVNFITQSLDDIFALVSSWIFRDRERQFKLEMSGIVFPIQTIMEKTLQVPIQEISDIGNIYRLQTSATMRSYTGEIEFRKNITNIQLTSNIFNPATGASTTIATQNINPGITVLKSSPGSYIPPGQNVKG